MLTCDSLRDFSSFDKMLRLIAYCLRKTNASGTRRNDALSVKELAQAEIAIARMTQGESFAMERLSLEREQQVSKITTKGA